MRTGWSTGIPWKELVLFLESGSYLLPMLVPNSRDTPATASWVASIRGRNCCAQRASCFQYQALNQHSPRSSPGLSHLDEGLTAPSSCPMPASRSAGPGCAPLRQAAGSVLSVAGIEPRASPCRTCSAPCPHFSVFTARSHLVAQVVLKPGILRPQPPSPGPLAVPPRMGSQSSTQP